jgi:cyclopropane-fatty-acyl-phospholipid synthase
MNDNTERGVARQVEKMARGLLGEGLPVRLRTWDGSEAGPESGPVAVVGDSAVVRRLLWRRNELGLAQAFIAKEIDVEGDLHVALTAMWEAYERQKAAGVRPPRHLVSLFTLAVRWGVLGRSPMVPLEPIRLSGPEHSRGRAREVVANHYDLSNDFYELILDPSMAYSCGYWTEDGPDFTLADAQHDKLELICHKLALEPGMRVLDVGCGWGSFALHAARRRGVHVTAVTLSEQQHRYVSDRVEAERLGGFVEVRLQDYRDVAGGPFDAAAAVEVGEHVGARNYPVFVEKLRSSLRPGAKLLIQQMSRPTASPTGGAFIEAYIAPDMHMRPLAETADLIGAGGFEVLDVQDLREHYALTIRAWLTALENHWNEAVGLVGEPTARMWRLYLAGSALAFSQRRMGVEQFLAVKSE